LGYKPGRWYEVGREVAENRLDSASRNDGVGAGIQANIPTTSHIHPVISACTH